jgi:hypothetical protein
MKWIIYLAISLVLLFVFVVTSIVRSNKKYKRGRLLDAPKLLFVGVVLSSLFLFIPICAEAFVNSENSSIVTFFASVHNTIRLFTADGDFEFMEAYLPKGFEFVRDAYEIAFSVLYIAAPLLTFGFVLSFFKNISAYRRLFAHFYKDLYVFSELNEKSLTLAESLDDGKRFFIFTGVDEKKLSSPELMESAKETGAIFFEKDILSIGFRYHSKKSTLRFFVIGENMSGNVTSALKLTDIYRNRENTDVYVFSTALEAEYALAKAYKPDESTAVSKVRLRRVNEVKSLINRTLYDKGHRIFETALHTDGKKQINAVILGMGKHGREMTKALAWYCQMDGYEIRINSFDADTMAESKFKSLCPELMSEEHNGKFDSEGDAMYDIRIHSGIDFETAEFDEIIASLPPSTYIFVALGEDDKNISAALKLHTLCRRAGNKPIIQAIVYDSEKNSALQGIGNFKNVEYEIEFIGDLKSNYSESVILDCDVEREALERHLVYGSEIDFWRYSYNYDSSVACAIHKKARKLCHISGADKLPSERSDYERDTIRMLEHRRWNAYMRSIGYVYADTRDDLAKTHHCLVEYARLSPEHQHKDDD